MQRSGVSSCLPGLLSQFGFGADGNPGDLPVDTLAFVGALAVREAQLDEALTKVGMLANAYMAAETKLAIVGMAVSVLRPEFQRAQRDAAYYSNRADYHRDAQFDAEDKLSSERSAHEVTKAALAEAEKKLAAITGALNGSKKDEPEGGEGAPATPLH